MQRFFSLAQPKYDHSLRKALSTLSSGGASTVPVMMPAEYLATSLTPVKRTDAIIQNTQNAFFPSSPGWCDGDRRQGCQPDVDCVMAQGVTKNSSDIENYSKIYELQTQLNQVKQQKFNGISLFAIQGHTLGNGGINGYDEGIYTPSDALPRTTTNTPNSMLVLWSVGRRHYFAQRNQPAICSVNRISSGVGVGADIDLGEFRNAPGAGGVNIGADGYITSITPLA